VDDDGRRKVPQVVVVLLLASGGYFRRTRHLRRLGYKGIYLAALPFRVGPAFACRMKRERVKASPK